MTITSSEIMEDSEQADGSRHIGVRFVSHTGKEVIRRFWADKNFDTSKDIAVMIPGIETYMAQEEVEEVVDLIERGETIPKLNFATAEQVKILSVEREAVKTLEIAKLTDEKFYLGEVE